MSAYQNKNKFMGFLAFGLFVLTGTYNAVVINSESHLSGNDVRFVKRLDELYGVTVPGRVVAAAKSWQKLTPTQIAQFNEAKIQQNIKTTAAAPAIDTSTSDSAPQSAAVQEELSLSLVEVINPKKWQAGLPNTQFNGNLATNNGVIESLSVALPNGEGLDVSFSEMTGNVFEYDVDGEVYSGMMYQVDQHAYMVTLTNGPLEGTRLRFASEQPAVEQQEVQDNLANNGVEVGNFGNDSSQDQYGNNSEAQTTTGYVQAQEVASPEVQSIDPVVQSDQQMQMEALQAQGFNLDQQQAM